MALTLFFSSVSVPRPLRSSPLQPRARPFPRPRRRQASCDPSLSPLPTPPLSSSSSMSSAPSSASHSSASSATKTPSLPDTARLEFLPHASGGLALVDPKAAGAGLGPGGYVVRPGVEGEAWSRVLLKVEQGTEAERVSFVGSVGEKGIWLRGRESLFKKIYTGKFYSTKVTFTGPDGHGYRWQLGSSWKGDNLHLVDTATSRVVLQLLRPKRGPHQLVLTPQSAPLAEFLILAALQRVWALGLAGPEVSVDEWAKLAAKADAEEYSIW